MAVAVVASVGSAGCRDARSVTTAPGVDVLVVAPHPDDEILIAGGVMRQAVARGARVAVILMTNGDFTCARDGYVREAETIDALARAGVAEDDVHFLGYPDGYLAELGEDPREVERRGSHGECARFATTYADRGASHADAHAARTGQPALYVADAIVSDLASLFAMLRPRDLYVTHAIDTHPDHAATYAFVRRAMERLPSLAPSLTVHRGVVHAGPCWPNGGAREEPCPLEALSLGTPLPPLPDPLGGYSPREHVAIDSTWKLDVIARYPSQTGGDVKTDWLGAFARSDEVFYPERLVADPLAPGELRRAPSPGIASGVAFAHGPWRSTTDARRTRDITQRAPLRFTSTVATGDRGGAASIDLMVSRVGGDGYRLTIDRAHATLERMGAAVTRLRAWWLPSDHLGGAPHVYTLRVDPRPDDGDVTEVTLRRDGALIGVAIDPRAAPQGDAMAIDLHGSAEATPPEATPEPR